MIEERPYSSGPQRLACGGHVEGQSADDADEADGADGNPSLVQRSIAVIQRLERATVPSARAAASCSEFFGNPGEEIGAGGAGDLVAGQQGFGFTDADAPEVFLGSGLRY